MIISMLTCFRWQDRLFLSCRCTAFSPRVSNSPGRYLTLGSFLKSSSRIHMSSSRQETELEKKLVHLNHAGASPSPQRVLDRVFKHLQLEQDDGGYAAQNAVQNSGDLDKVYKDIGRLIHVPTGKVELSLAVPEIALVESATVGWTRAFYAFVQRDEKERNIRAKADPSRPSATTRVILISEADYAANVVAACQWARDNDEHWMVLAIPSSEDSDNRSTGMVDLEVFDAMLEGRFLYKNKQGEDELLDPSCIAVVCITHVPTNSGIVNPVEEIGDRISAYNKLQQRKVEELKAVWTYHDSIKYLVDACQSVGQMDVNVQKIKCDGLVSTG